MIWQKMPTQGNDKVLARLYMYPKNKKTPLTQGIPTNFRHILRSNNMHALLIKWDQKWGSSVVQDSTQIVFTYKGVTGKIVLK